MTPRLWLREILIALDRLGNALLRGSADETMSSRAHRARMKHQPYWWWLATAIDWAFFLLFLTDNLQHCEHAWQYESRRWSELATEDTAGLALTNHMKDPL